MRQCSWVICADTSRHTRFASGLHVVSVTTQLTLSVISRSIRLANIITVRQRHRGLSHVTSKLITVVCSAISAIISSAMRQIWSDIYDWDMGWTLINLTVVLQSTMSCKLPSVTNSRINHVWLSGYFVSSLEVLDLPADKKSNYHWSKQVKW